MNSVDSYECATQFINFTNQNIFITGKAGTGKTTFLHKLRSHGKKQMAVVAPTGVAAINAGGATIHSFFQLPLAPFMPTSAGRDSLISTMKMNSSRRRVIRELELLVIDEISMVRADVLDAIDAVLRHVRHRSTQPFGGVQMVFIGDMYQLSPVAQPEEWRILAEHYNGIYFFNSKVIQEQPPIYIEFDHIFRQSDQKFIDALNGVRNNSLSPESLAILQSRYNPSFVPPKDKTYITLTTHNYKADSINNNELAKIKASTYSFEATIKGSFPEKSYPVEHTLDLKVGAKVMFVRNDTEMTRRFFNGKIGEVTKIFKGEGFIMVKCPGDKDEIQVEPMTWENVQFTVDEVSTTVERTVLGTFTQYPLRLAWAITIHKSQGLTFDYAIIDAEAAFSPGQVYVALSRCRTLEGLILESPLNLHSIHVDNQIARFSSQAPTNDILKEQLNSSKRNYQGDVLLQLFDFMPLLNAAMKWRNDTTEKESSFSAGTLDFIKGVINDLWAIEQIASKFRVQLKEITKQAEPDNEFLKQRLKASATYFSEKLSAMAAMLKESPASTDNRNNAQDYDDSIKSIFTGVEQKKHVINVISNGFSIETYFSARNSFTLPPFNISAYSRSSNAKQQIRSEHPELLNELIELRDEISEEEVLPVYIVASIKTLVEMSDKLPQTKKELLKIHGIGKNKVERFGHLFLEVIRNYAEANGLTSSIDLMSYEEKAAKPKRNKGDSAKESFQMYSQGLSIAEIATRRNLVENTIAGHLSKYVLSGELQIEAFIKPEKIEDAKRQMALRTGDNSYYSIFAGILTPPEITLFLAWMRREAEKPDNM